MLVAARIDPRALISFLQLMAPAETGAPTALDYFGSHPAIVERIATLERLAAEVRDTPTPITTGHDWKKLSRSCGA